MEARRTEIRTPVLGASILPMHPVVSREGSQPGGLEVLERQTGFLDAQDADAAFLRGTGVAAQLQAAHVTHDRPVEMLRHLPPRARVVSEEVKLRTGQAQQRRDLLAAAVHEDGVARGLV